jgi:hypothetical protein
MGDAVTERAAVADEEPTEAPAVQATCIGCGRVLETVLQQLGSLRCHDCRDDGGDYAGARRVGSS